ncbi:MAG: hypothetical protein M1835_007146 [Candelina submexicana]|nr:MAG: hypothetical protein M1835_007146 [Candelina submexicana]
MQFSVIFGVSFIATAFAFDCSILPIYVDIHKRAVAGTETFEYGSFVGVGSPAQNQSLWPSLSYNDTSVADVDYCKGSNLTDCEHHTGGYFDLGHSATWKSSNDYLSSDLAEQASDSGIYGEDKMHLYTHYFQTDPASERVIHNFLIRLAQNGSSYPGRIGLGATSTLLDRLRAASMICSRSFSLYVGSGFDRAGGVINGSNVFGGYDAARFTGQVYNHAIDATNVNPFGVRVTDIILSDPADSSKNVSLLDKNRFSNIPSAYSGFDAKITTEQYPLSLPYEITQNFRSTLAAQESDSHDGSLRITKPYRGSMTIILSTGFTVTLPREVVYNASGLSPVAARTKDSLSPFYLSTAWLSQVYLMADYDDQKFHLAQAVAEAPFITTRTMCPGQVPVAYEPSKKPEKAFNRVGLIGAVLGGVVGGMALITVVVCGTMFWRRRRCNKAIEEIENAKESFKVTQREVDDSASQTSMKSKMPFHEKWFLKAGNVR